MSEVQQRLDQGTTKEATKSEPERWNEVVEEIWEKWLPHFRGAVFTGDGDFLFDVATGRYLFQNYYQSEGEDDLIASDKEEEGRG